MAEFIQVLLPRLIPDIQLFCVPHDGKRDLQRSVPNKLRGWREPGAQFVIVQDQDEACCVAVKSRYLDMCVATGRPETLVRIVCRELEAWYLGDPDAMIAAFPMHRSGIERELGKPRYRYPDAISLPSNVVKRLVPGRGKIEIARAMGQTMSQDNVSPSFRTFLGGVRRVWASIGYPDGV